jgi:divalent metal cation (Fe/Co/Zn/Cd) transporter
MFLEYLTLGWNLVEGIVAVSSGAIAGSIALVGFGIDSFIEMSSGAIMLWRLRSESSGANAEQVEQRALRLVGISFFLLAAYVAVDSVKSVVQRAASEHSPVGIGLAISSLLVMPWLAHQKRRAAGTLNSNALHADSRQTSLCAYLSAILLGGLLLNALFGWWWADPVAGLAMVPIVAREGWQALKGERCRDGTCWELAMVKQSAFLESDST